MWSALLHFFRQERERFLAGGWEVVETTRRSLLSLEARIGAGLFAALYLLSRWQSPVPAPYPFPVGPAFARLVGAAGTTILLFDGLVLLLHLMTGALLGIFLTNAWDLVETAFPIPPRRAWPRRRLWASVGGILLLMHGGFLLSAMRSAPALFTPAFHDQGGPLRWFQDWGATGFLSLPGRLLTLLAWGVAGAGAAQMVRRFQKWYRSFPVPTRIASAVIGLGTFFLFLGLWGVFRFHRPPNEGPNAVVLAVDGLRTDQLRDIDRTPAMNVLARRGWAFASCVPTVPGREPALMTLLTGRSPLSHGVRHAFPAEGDARLLPEALPPYFRGMGYETAVLSDAGGDLLGRLSRYFDRVRAPDLSVPGIKRRDALRRAVHLLPYVRGSWARKVLPPLRAVPELADPRALAREATAMLKQLRFKRRFFLLVHLAEGRDPKAVDEAVGEVLSSLEDLGLGQSTWVVLWAPVGANPDGTPDDGKEVTSPARFAAPLVVSGPVRRPAPPWIRFPIRDVDVAPTLLAALGLPIPEVMEGIPLLGIDAENGGSFLRDIYTESDLWLDPEDNPLPEEVRLTYGPPSSWLEEDPDAPGRLQIHPPVEDKVLAYRHRLFQTEGERVVYRPSLNGVIFEYYDLRKDPAAETDLAGTTEGMKRVKELKETFFQELRREVGWRPQNDFWIPEAFMREKR